MMGFLNVLRLKPAAAKIVKKLLNIEQKERCMTLPITEDIEGGVFRNTKRRDSEGLRRLEKRCYKHIIHMYLRRITLKGIN